MYRSATNLVSGEGAVVQHEARLGEGSRPQGSVQPTALEAMLEFPVTDLSRVDLGLFELLHHVLYAGNPSHQVVVVLLEMLDQAALPFSHKDRKDVFLMTR